MAAVHPKITASALAGAFVGLLITELQRRNITIDPGESANLTLIVMALVGYFVPGNDADNGGGNVDHGVVAPGAGGAPPAGPQPVVPPAPTINPTPAAVPPLAPAVAAAPATVTPAAPPVPSIIVPPGANP